MTQQQSAMRIAGGALMAIGVLFALTALSFLHPVVHVFLQAAYWPIHDVPAELAAPGPLLVVISGSLTAGLGAMHWALGTYVAPLSATAAAKTAQIAAWVWFCLDSSGSVLVGAPANVVLNLSFLILMLMSCRLRTAGEHATS